MTPPPESFVFNGAENSSFETVGNFAGGIAPGNSLDVGESVTIASNTASIASGSLIDDGSITVNSGAGFIDTGAVAGTGTLSILSGASASLTGGGSLGSIIDAGSLTVAGTFAGPISLASGAQLTLFDFTDNSSIAGAGTLAVTSGGYIQLGGNISLGAILDSGAFVLTGTGTASSIDMEGDWARSTMAFGGSNDAAEITNFGKSDIIALGTGVLSALPAGDAFELGYASGVLTVTEANSSGGTVGATQVTVAVASGDTASFLALAASLGVEIELASSLADQSFTFNGADDARSTSFEEYDNYAGGIAPGDNLASGETVNIISGMASVSGSGLVDGGAISVTGSGTALEVDVPVTGTGLLLIDSGAAVTLSAVGATDSGLSVIFGTNGTALAPDTLVLDDTSFNGTISGFGLHDTLVDGAATYNAADGFTFNNGVGWLIGAGGTVLETFKHFSVTGGATSGVLDVVSGPSGAVEVVLCFYAGVKIATPAGEVAVEDLHDGDMVLTANGSAHPIVWLGKSHISTRFADPLRFLPIRITASALGDGLPVRDLLVSPCHAIYLDGILVQAGALVNDTTILRETAVPENFIYYHVELAHHALLIADGALTESFVDNVDRMNFHNWADRTVPAEPIAEMDLPRAKAARQVPQSIRRRLMAQEQRQIA
jgi:Hint domain